MTTKLPQAAPGMFASLIPLPAPVIAGLENARWPGRCQQVIDPARDGTGANAGKTTWFLDGAHTVESLKACAQWFTSPGVTLPIIQTGEVSDTPLRCDREPLDTTKSLALTDFSASPKRALIFNCTSGRSGLSFLSTLLESTSSQLEKYQQTPILHEHPGFFDLVIFCTNVTYADGHFKGGMSIYITMAISNRSSHSPPYRSHQCSYA